MLFAVTFLLSLSAIASNTVYFSPTGGCEKAVVSLISETKSQLDVAVYSINNSAILKALDEAKERGVKIRILTDRTQAAVNGKTTLALERKGFDLRIHSSGRIMHNKFAVSDKTKAITGSFNWTNPAETLNEENCISLDDREMVSKFDHRFSDHLWMVNTLPKSQKSLARIKERLSKRPENDRHLSSAVVETKMKQ